VGTCDKKSTQGMTQVPRLRTERVNPTFLETNTGFSAFRTEDLHGFFRAKHRLFDSQRSTRVLCKLGAVLLLRASYTLRQSGGMGEEPFHNSSWPFYSHASGLTLVTHGTTCVPFNMHSFPFGSPSSFSKT
jgi:hypothetical protein